MKLEHIGTLLLAAGLVTVLTAGACDQQPREPELLVATTPATHLRAEKTYAPVDIRLTSSARVGVAEIVLTVTPLIDLPNARARIIVPDGVTLVSGSPEAELGQLAQGRSSSIAVRVKIPDIGSHVLAGGVEVELSASRKVARATVLEVGVAAKRREALVVRLPEGGSVRVQE